MKQLESISKIKADSSQPKRYKRLKELDRSNRGFCRYYRMLRNYIKQPVTRNLNTDTRNLIESKFEYNLGKCTKYSKPIDYNNFKIKDLNTINSYILTVDDDIVNVLRNEGLEVGTMRERKEIICLKNGKRFDKRVCKTELVDKKRCLCDYMKDRNMCSCSKVVVMKPYTFLNEIEKCGDKVRDLLIIYDINRFKNSLINYYSFNYKKMSSIEDIKENILYEIASYRKKGFLNSCSGKDLEEYECRMLMKRGFNYYNGLSRKEVETLIEIKRVLRNLEKVRSYRFDKKNKIYFPSDRGIFEIMGYITRFGKTCLIGTGDINGLQIR